MMSTSWGAACGKAILLGEHAVVYGIPALGVGLSQGVQACGHTASCGPSRLRLSAWEVDVSEQDDDPLGKALKALLHTVPRSIRSPVHLEASTNLPPGSGLGCSAALGVALARAVDPAASLDATTQRAMAWEQVFHGNPSGVDVAIAARGGGLLFEKGKRSKSIETGELLLAIGHSGKTSKTHTMVEQVADLRTRNRAGVDAWFEEIGLLVIQGVNAIRKRCLETLGTLMDRNQALLHQLTVSTPALEQLCLLAKGAGALGAKLTGAGGGGCVIALAAHRFQAEAICAAWSAQGFAGFVAEVNPAAESAAVREAYAC